MELTIVVPDDLGRRVRELPDPDEFVTETLKAALRTADTPQNARPSRWAKVAKRIAEDPTHLQGYSEKLIRDSRQVRDDFVLGGSDSE